MKQKYVKVVFGETSGAKASFQYKIGEVNIDENFHPEKESPEEMGGFNFSTEDKIIRWLVRGDTLYDVKLPVGAIVVDCPSKSTPHGVFRTNKIILENPRKVTDELAMELYLQSTIPEKSYYKALAGLMVRGYRKTMRKVIEDHVSIQNIEEVLKEVEDFLKPENGKGSGSTEVIEEGLSILHQIQEEKEKATLC